MENKTSTKSRCLNSVQELYCIMAKGINVFVIIKRGHLYLRGYSGSYNQVS